jgi:hypothetical protein
MTQNAPKCKIESTHRGTFNLLNSIFVSFSLPTSEHFRELKFIFFFELNIFKHFSKVKYTTFLLLSPSDNENYFFV